MSGVMPAGQKAFSNINTVAGFPATNQINLGSLAAQYLGKVPGLTWVRMSDMSGRGLIIGEVLPDGSTANSPINIQSPTGSSVVSPWLDLNTAFGSGTWANVPNGNGFLVSSRVVATWANSSFSDTTPTYIFQKGVSGSAQTGGDTGDKDYYMITEYDALNNRVRVQGYYSGSSTSFPNGTVYIDRVSL